MTPRTPHPWTVFGLEGLQRLPGLHRPSVGVAERFLRAVFSFQPHLVGAVSVDSSGPAPDILASLPPDVPVLDSMDEAPHAPEGMVAVFHVLCLLGDDPVTTLWPEWARRSKTGLVTTVHDITSERQLESPPTGPVHNLRRSRYRLVEEADAVIATSHSAAAYAAGALETDPARTFVVPDGVRLPVRGRGSGGSGQATLGGSEAAEPPFILAFCDSLLSQGAGVLVQGFRSAAAGISSPLALRIVTESAGRAESIAAGRALSAETGETPITWAGSPADADIPHLLRACSGVVVHSLDTTLAWAAIEAMDAGAVTLLPDLGVFREIAPQPAARFDPGSVDDTEGAITRAVADEYFRRCRIEDASASAKAYSWQKTLSAAGRAYSLAAARRPASPRIAAR